LASPSDREAYGRVLVSPTMMLSSCTAKPAARLKARAPPQEPGQITTVIPVRR
jgi:hypothetical protein